MPDILTEQVAPVVVLQPDADRFAGTQLSDVVNMEIYRNVTFLVAEGAGGTGTYQIQVEATSDKAGNNAEEVPFRYRLLSAGDWGALTDATAATGYTTVAGTNKLVAVEVDAADLPDTKPHARLKTTEVADSPVDGAVLAILWQSRYNRDVMPHPLS